MVIFKNAFIFITLLVIISCSRIEELPTKVENSFINPPFNALNIDSQEYELISEKGDTFFHESGTVLCFPPNSIVDKDGNIVKGAVKITYREFRDPLDFFIAGIPMDYDSVGVNYTFESSAMCEIYAYKDSVALFIDDNNKPEISFLTNNKSTLHNLYFLDTIQKEWKSKGKDIIHDLKEEYTEVENAQPSFISPIKPEKASGKYPTFSISIDSASMPEIQAYNNLLFEVDESETSFNPKDTEIEWENITVKKSEIKGKYIVTFIKESRNLSIICRPVFEEKALENAMKLYDIKRKEYEKSIKDKLNNEEEIKLYNEKMNKRNFLIEARNRVIEKENERVLKQNKIVEKENEKVTAVNRIIEKENKRRDSLGVDREAVNHIYRVFALSGFGIWNVDKPVFKEAISVIANFTDEENRTVQLSNISVVYKGFNGISRYHDSNIKLITSADNMIWSVIGDKFVYVDSESINKNNIDTLVKEYSFKLEVHPDKISSKEDIMRIIGMN